MPEIMGDWPAFAFSQDEPWGIVLMAFLRDAYEHSGSNRTLVHYRQNLTDFFTSPAKLPPDYARDDVERYIYSPGKGCGRIGQSPKPGTINNRLSCLNSFYSFAAGYTIAGDQGVIQPVLRVPSPTLGIRHLKKTRTRHVLGASDVEKLLQIIPKTTEQGVKYHALFLTYIFTARRCSEILALRFRDIERVTLVENGQSRDTYTYAFSNKGTKRERDTAELPAPAATAIFAYLEYSGRLAMMKPDHAVFTADTSYSGRQGYDPMRPLSEQTVWAAAKRFARLAGVPEELVNIHMFRHFSAQQRYLLGEDILSLSHTLRHTSVGTTQIYLEGLTTIGDPGAILLEQRFGNL